MSKRAHKSSGKKRQQNTRPSENFMGRVQIPDHFKGYEIAPQGYTVVMENTPHVHKQFNDALEGHKAHGLNIRKVRKKALGEIAISIDPAYEDLAISYIRAIMLKHKVTVAAFNNGVNERGQRPYGPTAMLYFTDPQQDFGSMIQEIETELSNQGIPVGGNFGGKEIENAKFTRYAVKGQGWHAPESRPYNQPDHSHAALNPHNPKNVADPFKNIKVAPQQLLASMPTHYGEMFGVPWRMMANGEMVADVGHLSSAALAKLRENLAKEKVKEKFESGETSAVTILGTEARATTRFGSGKTLTLSKEDAAHMEKIARLLVSTGKDWRVSNSKEKTDVMALLPVSGYAAKDVTALGNAIETLGSRTIVDAEVVPSVVDRTKSASQDFTTLGKTLKVGGSQSRRVVNEALDFAKSDEAKAVLAASQRGEAYRDIPASEHVVISAKTLDTDSGMEIKAGTSEGMFVRDVSVSERLFALKMSSYAPPTEDAGQVRAPVYSQLPEMAKLVEEQAKPAVQTRSFVTAVSAWVKSAYAKGASFVMAKTGITAMREEAKNMISTVMLSLSKGMKEARREMRKEMRRAVRLARKEMLKAVKKSLRDFKDSHNDNREVVLSPNQAARRLEQNGPKTRLARRPHFEHRDGDRNKWSVRKDVGASMPEGATGVMPPAANARPAKASRWGHLSPVPNLEENSTPVSSDNREVTDQRVSGVRKSYRDKKRSESRMRPASGMEPS